MNLADTMWCAGFVEGEGSIYRPKRVYRTHPRWKVMQVDREPLDRLQAVTGMGRITGPYQYGSSKPHYHWSLTTRADVDVFTALIFPHLSERRKQQVLGALR